mmetsp:Transcript_2287/g.7004  ORF Transcript_2287/g.7004 Transcript_2287/m.7004 type:complete len:271 (+) Transcript_2287:676-1488(+)
MSSEEGVAVGAGGMARAATGLPEGDENGEGEGEGGGDDEERDDDAGGGEGSSSSGFFRGGGGGGAASAAGDLAEDVVGIARELGELGDVAVVGLHLDEPDGVSWSVDVVREPAPEGVSLVGELDRAEAVLGPVSKCGPRLLRTETPVVVELLAVPAVADGEVDRSRADAALADGLGPLVGVDVAGGDNGDGRGGDDVLEVVARSVRGDLRVDAVLLVRRVPGRVHADDDPGRLVAVEAVQVALEPRPLERAARRVGVRVERDHVDAADVE